MPDKFLHNQKGEIMVEAMIAITIAVVGLLGIFGFLSQSLSLNKTVGNSYTATYLAAEGIEIVKNLADGQPWGSLSCSNPCYVQYDTLAAPISSGSGALYFDGAHYSHSGTLDQLTNFSRKIFIAYPQDPNKDEIQVRSLVEWTGRGGGSFKVDLEDHFFNLKQ